MTCLLDTVVLKVLQRTDTDSIFKDPAQMRFTDTAESSHFPDRAGFLIMAVDIVQSRENIGKEMAQSQILWDKGFLT